MSPRADNRLVRSNNRPIRVLHLLAGCQTTGVGRYVSNLGEGMRRLGHEVTIAGRTGACGPWFDEADEQWLDLTLAPWPPAAFCESVKLLRQHLQHHPADVIHTHCRWSTALARAVPQGLRPPVLNTLHVSGRKLSRRNRWLTDFGDHTHVASQQSLDWLVNAAGVPASQITLIPHGLDAERFPEAQESDRVEARRLLGLPSDALVAAYVGALEAVKNPGWMLDLAQTPQSQLPGLRVVIAGEGPLEEQLRGRIGREGLAERAILLGWCDPLTVYRAADALMLPSKLEGFSYVCAEAMSVGRPVLRTRTAGSAEQIQQGVTGWSASVSKVTFIQSAIKFLTDRDGLSRMGASAAEHTRDQFTLDRQLSQTEDLYRQLVSSFATPTHLKALSDRPETSPDQAPPDGSNPDEEAV